MKQPDESQHQSGAAAAANGQGELELLRAECARLRERLKEVEKERDDYLKSLYAYVLAEITDEDLEEYAKIDEKDYQPLSAFLPELERIVRGEKS